MSGILKFKRQRPAWKPDIQDGSLIDTAKADFIYDGATVLLGETVALNEYLNGSARKTLTFLTGTLSAVAVFILLKCDMLHGVCEEKPHLYVPAVILLFGYVIGAALLIIGCLLPRSFRFRGNEPRNLLTTAVCQYSLERIKIAEAINMQMRIENNAKANTGIAWCLIGAYGLAVFTPLISFIVAVRY